jgi:hypothetical protein
LHLPRIIFGFIMEQVELKNVEVEVDEQKHSESDATQQYNDEAILARFGKKQRLRVSLLDIH